MMHSSGFPLGFSLLLLLLLPLHPALGGDGPGGLPAYDSVVRPGAETSRGYMTLHRLEGKYLLEVPLPICGRDLLVVNVVGGVTGRLNETGMNRGHNFQNQLIRLEHDAHTKRLLIRAVNPVPECLEGRICASVQANFLAPILAGLPLLAYGPDSASVVVDATGLFDGTNDALGNIFASSGLGVSPKRELSSIREAKAFETNLMIRSELGAHVAEDQTKTPITIRVTTNIVLLPETPMVARFADQRLGLFSEPKTYFSDHQQRADKRRIITRWRLEPRPEDRARYLAGELVEPQHPIIFHIDSTTPRQWAQFIAQGIEDWQEAFEQAGWRNAIQARMQGEGTDLDDARISSVTYAASEVANAMGPSVVDPRSGEIIESDIMWWHNVMGAVQRWMRLQIGLLVPEVRGNTVSEAWMGQAIRFVAAHEVGHTLGLMHNMAASHAYSLQELRDPAFTAEHGTASSIMDYARFNYVAQPGDSIAQLTPRIGPYDRLCIEYAYRWRPVASPFDEEELNDSLISQHRGDPRYFFGPQADSRTLVDPRAQSEDLGDNSVEASRLGIANLKRIVPQALEWTGAGRYVEGGKFLHDLIDQWHLYAYHVLANVGGIYLHDQAYCTEHPSFEPVPRARQQEAVSFLCQEVLTYPEWLFGDSIMTRVYPTKSSPDGPYEYSPMELFKNYQGYIVWDLLADERLARMVENQAQNPETAYGAEELLNDLHDFIFGPTARRKVLNTWQRIAQKNFVDALIISGDRGVARKDGLRKARHLYTEAPPSLRRFTPPCANDDRSFTSATRRIKFEQLKRTGDVLSLKRGELIRIYELLLRRSRIRDQATRAHYIDLSLRIEDALGINWKTVRPRWSYIHMYATPCL